MPNVRLQSPGVRAYLDSVLRACTQGEVPLVSLVLFGSAARGTFAEDVSDVDLILVLRDDATPEQRRRVSEELTRLELLHRLRAPRTRPRRAIEAFLDRAGGNALSGFVCTRSDLLSGNVARALDLGPVEALLVDRIVFATIVTSAVTLWGEDLLPHVPLPPVRRVDVFKALFGFCGQVLLSAITFPVLPEATKYAMGALKRSLHSCYFCYHERTAALEVEADFFERHLRAGDTLAELLALRRDYRRSFSFVVRCIPTLVRLHWRTARDNAFPIQVLWPRGSVRRGPVPVR